MRVDRMVDARTYKSIYLQVEDGEVPITQATAPAAAGVAMDVPDMLMFIHVCGSVVRQHLVIKIVCVQAEARAGARTARSTGRPGRRRC